MDFGWYFKKIVSKEKGADAMGNTLWFISILKDHPSIGFLIGLLFVATMFGSKNLIVYIYAKNHEKKKAVSEPDN